MAGHVLGAPGLSVELSAALKRAGLVGSHPAFLEAAAEALALAPFTGIPLLILGPSGSGKEGMAALIHGASGRPGPLVVVSCANLGEALAESVLFGAERGAFTGAVRRRVGLFEEAKGGTLFFDEVGDLPLEVQRQLLRALQSRVIRRVGGEVDIAVDVRIVAATWREIPERVREGHFREDLYYRLAGHVLRLPPLAARGGDVVEIARHLVCSDPVCRQAGGLRLSAEGEGWLLRGPWPGNVRELQGILRTAAVFAPAGVIDAPLLDWARQRREGPAAGEGGPVVAAGVSGGRWLSNAEFAARAGIHPRAARKALRRAQAGKRWRDAALRVREVRDPRGSGRGGIRYEVWCQSLPGGLGGEDANAVPTGRP